MSTTLRKKRAMGVSSHNKSTILLNNNTNEGEECVHKYIMNKLYWSNVTPKHGKTMSLSARDSDKTRSDA